MNDVLVEGREKIVYILLRARVILGGTHVSHSKWAVLSSAFGISILAAVGTELRLMSCTAPSASQNIFPFS